MVTALEPAMPSAGAPEWPGARWVGAIDVRAIPTTGRVPLRCANGYLRARLLVRDGAQVRGFVDVGIDSGTVDAAGLARAAAALPRDQARPGPAGSAAATPSITVVVCTRDRAAHLRLALTAILRIDYPAFEVVVVDNAPAGDETRRLIRSEFPDPRVRLVTEPVPGLSRARNTGLAVATGEFVAFTDDDVVVDRHWLTQLVAGFSMAPGVDLVSGLVPSGELRTRVQGFFDDRVSWSRNLRARRYSLADPPPDLAMFPFSVGEYGTGANFAVRRSAATALGGFDTAFGVGTRAGGGEDLDMFTRVILDGRSLVMQPSALVWHRHRDDLAALRVQARGYGTGLGAWLTKILLRPSTARIAIVRAPHALGRLLSLAWRRPEVSVVDHNRDKLDHTGDALDRTISRVGFLELFSVALGPIAYARQRAAGEGTMRFPA